MKHYAFIDFATQGYIALVALLILCLHGGTVPNWGWLLLLHAVTMALVHVLVVGYSRNPANGVLGFLRHFYPVLLYTAFYRETGELNRMLAPEYLDPFFVRLDEMIFGTQLSLVFMDRLPYWPVSELFYISYFSYYVMIAGVGLALFLRNRTQFFHYVSVLSFVFYACYLIYIFLPVIGPRLFYREVNGYQLPLEAMPAVIPEFPGAVQAGPFYQIMAWIYRIFEAPGAEFPSSHVAVAIVTVWFSFRYLPRIRFLHLTMVVLLCLSTVYCRYHYAVDIIGGIVTAAALIPLGNWFYARFRRPTPECSTGGTPQRPVQPS
jgi:membrane-associated phospholipid phosphatase